ncbi:MAG TPA: class I SAM-dependent methyltransferase [Acidimicrobiia bacterium]|nr:class I SAM-dependent methyltransferase [Acidimicrobiia bacterium]
MSLRERGFAAIYDRLVAPSEEAFLRARRNDLVGAAAGVVLEIGGGTGANLPHYRKASRVVVTEPSAAMRAKLGAKLDEAAAPVTVAAAGAEAVPYPDGFFDTVVTTLVLCTVDDLDASLAEIRRVLKPGGELRFLEHVRGAGREAEWQDRLQPVWTWLAVGCYPNRDTEGAIRDAGFTIDEIERFVAPGPPTPVRPLIQGLARRP